MDECGAKRGQAPQDSTDDDERLAAKPVAEPASERRDDHIGEKERRGQRAHLLVGGMKLTLDQRLLAGQNIAVDVVEQIEGEQKRDGADGGAESELRASD